MAIPGEVRAYGVEIDPAAALQAIENSGREVVVGDFRFADLPERPTAIVGNPPFQADLVEDFMDRCHQLLEYGGKVGFILPVYLFQTANTLMRFHRRWSIAQELLPRNMFQGMSKPIMFASFTKERRVTLSGFFLYAETAALESLRPEFREMFCGNKSRAGVWKETVHRALSICGGRATLNQLYECIENSRPTETKFWREKIRQVAGRHFHRIDKGEYSLQEAA